MSCAAIHLLSLIPLFCSVKLISQHLLMQLQYGRFVKMVYIPADNPDDEIQYVLDGGALQQCIPWSSSSTFGDICHQYTEYIVRKYNDAIVVFDGYENYEYKRYDTSETVKGRVLQL